MQPIQVCVIGCGPIGLACALLLAKFGIRTVVVERRGEMNTHPRSRFVDTNTMELMRLLGVEKEIEATGLGPDWTEYNRWFDAIVGEQIAAIASPTFHTVDRQTSPTRPVMTCQDYVEGVLMDSVAQTNCIELRFRTEAIALNEDASGVAVSLRNLENGQEDALHAEYVLGTDGPHSFARQVIGSELQATPRGQYSQDVIFEADLSKFVGQRKGGLLYALTMRGVLIFQPLNGVTRWRCQIFKADSELLSEEETKGRICEAVGVPNIPIDIVSMGIWQPTPGCVDRLSRGRIFLAGDAAHVSLPTGGMGNNIGFAGARNLTWKLAYVLRGLVEPEILDTYHEEHHALALDRIGVGIETTEYMGSFIRAYYAGEDTQPGIQLTQQYGDYDGAILGYEMCSGLIATENKEPPAVAHPTIDFVPCIRAGRRAPHVWVDAARKTSVLDWFSTHYTLVCGAGIDCERWRACLTQLEDAFPLRLQRLMGCEQDIYPQDGLVLVRPDGIIADYWIDSAVAPGNEWQRLSELLPIRADQLSTRTNNRLASARA